MDDGEPLEYVELLGLAGLYSSPVGVLECRKIIMLDKKKLKHRKIITEEEDRKKINILCVKSMGTYVL